jgi:hypothetical protein
MGRAAVRASAIAASIVGRSLKAGMMIERPLTR